MNARPLISLRSALLSANGLGFLLALGVALPSLAWPYGGDQALFDYVGRAWLDGAWPYEGAMEHKPPGVFLLFMLARMLDGGGQWGIRAMELVLVLSLAVPVAGLVGEGRLDRGRAGLAALLCAGFYWVPMDYWRSAQTEIWIVAAALWACWLARERGLLAQVLAGALLGFAFTMKFTVVLLALPVAVLVVVGGREVRPYVRGGAFVLGGLAVCTAVFAPFLASGRGDALWASLVEFNRYYRQVVPFLEWGWGDFWLRAAPVVTLAAGLGMVVAVLRPRDSWRSVALWLGLTAAALLSVVWQGKYLAYHWGVALPLAAGWTLWGLDALRRVHGRAPLVAGVSLLASSVALQRPPVFHSQDWAPRPYRQAVLDLATVLDRDTYLDHFDYLHSTADQAAVARQAQDLARPGDSLCVVGIFAPAVYAWTDLRCPSPFFSDHGLAYLDWKPDLAGELGAWRARHEAELVRHPSTFVVTTLEHSQQPERQAGVPYGVVGNEGTFLLMKRVEP